MAQRNVRLESEKQQFVNEVEASARAARAGKQAFLAWEGKREFRISAMVDESDGVKSIYLTDPHGHALPGFEPGQYLTCYFRTAEGEKPLVRCYSLSDRPHDEYYRLTVKRCDPPTDQPDLPPGRASHRLHEMRVGDTLLAAAPRGEFFLDPRRRDPIVLVAGGIGVTPLLSMLASLVHLGDPREIYFVYGVRNGSEHPLRDEIEGLTEGHPHIHLLTAYSQPRASDQSAVDYQQAGRITADYLREVVPTGRYDYYLCGPGGMMASLVEGLLDQGVPADRIRYEAFGPASVRRPAATESGADSSESVDPKTIIRFESSQKEAAWDNRCDSLLDLIEQTGVAIDSGCRAGSCGMCATRVLEGEFTTVKSPGTLPPDDHCLACISIPTSPLVLDI